MVMLEKEATDALFYVIITSFEGEEEICKTFEYQSTNYS